MVPFLISYGNILHVMTCFHCSGNPHAKSSVRNNVPVTAAVNPVAPPLKLKYSDQQSRPHGAGWIWCNTHASRVTHLETDCKLVPVNPDIKIRIVKLKPSSDHLVSNGCYSPEILTHHSGITNLVTAGYRSLLTARLSAHWQCLNTSG
jgi:hypothetical protein